MLWVGFAGPWRVSLWISYWDSLFPLHKPDDHQDYKVLLRANLHEPGRMDALHAMLFLSKADTTAILPTTHVPALVVMGTADPDFDDATQEAAFVAGQLHAQTMLVAGAGHYPQVEAPAQVAPRIINFLRALP
jgi:pimeloyl-ACP methyl ester carboxylesterase